jgi:broad specificity phosphatase PhoE
VVATLYLARHGRAAAGYGEDEDPGLDDLGRAQAHQLALALEARGPLPMLVSPLRRTVETAEPLARRWGIDPAIEDRVAEIPSPASDLADRAHWLKQAMAGTWAELPEAQQAWRAELLRFLLDLEEDTVVVTHFIAINAALGLAEGDDHLVQAMVANGACTVFESNEGVLRVTEAGGTAATKIL